MTAKRVPLDAFLTLSPDQVSSDYSQQVTSSPKVEHRISEHFGSGRVVTLPLVGEAGLVVMEAKFHEDIEVYSDENQQQSISFTLCLNGGLESTGLASPPVRLGRNQTLFVRYTQRQPRMASLFRGGVDHHFVTVYLSQDWIRALDSDGQSEILSDPCWEGVHIPGSVSKLMLALAREISNATRSDELKRQSISARVLDLWALQIGFLQRLPKPGPHNVCNVKPQDIARIHQAADILLQEIIDPPSLIELSRRIGVNDNKLKKAFKQIYGTTVYGFLQQHRLERARELICQRECNVMQAATSVGFSSASHFSTAFKKAYGFSPRKLLQPDTA